MSFQFLVKTFFEEKHKGCGIGTGIYFSLRAWKNANSGMSNVGYEDDTTMGP